MKHACVALQQPTNTRRPVAPQLPLTAAMDSSDLAVIVASTVLGAVTIALAAVLAGGRCRARLPCARGCCPAREGAPKAPTPSRWAPLARLAAAVARGGQPAASSPAIVSTDAVHVAVNVARSVAAAAQPRRPVDSLSREDDDVPGGSSSTSAGGSGSSGGLGSRPPGIITTASVVTSPAAAPQQPRHIARPDELDYFGRRRRRGPRPPRTDQPAPPGTALKPAGDEDRLSVGTGGLSASQRAALKGGRRQPSSRRLAVAAPPLTAVANPVAGALLRSGSRSHGIGGGAVSAIVLHPLHVVVAAPRPATTRTTTTTRRSGGTRGDSRGTVTTATPSVVAPTGGPPHTRRVSLSTASSVAAGASAAAVACLQPPVLSPSEWASPPPTATARQHVGAAASLQPAYNHRHMLPPRRPSLGSGGGTPVLSRQVAKHEASLARIAASLDAGAAVDAGSRGSAVGAFCAIDGRSEEAAAPPPNQQQWQQR